MISTFLALLEGMPRPREEISGGGISWWAVVTLAIILLTAVLAVLVAYLRKRLRR